MGDATSCCVEHAEENTISAMMKNRQHQKTTDAGKTNQLNITLVIDDEVDNTITTNISTNPWILELLNKGGGISWSFISDAITASDNLSKEAKKDFQHGYALYIKRENDIVKTKIIIGDPQELDAAIIPSEYIELNVDVDDDQIFATIVGTVWYYTKAWEEERGNGNGRHSNPITPVDIGEIKIKEITNEFVHTEDSDSTTIEQIPDHSFKTGRSRKRQSLKLPSTRKKIRSTDMKYAEPRRASMPSMDKIQQIMDEQQQQQKKMLEMMRKSQDQFQEMLVAQGISKSITQSHDFEGDKEQKSASEARRLTV